MKSLACSATSKASPARNLHLKQKLSYVWQSMESAIHNNPV
jgi:hypothetical protein